MKFCPQCGSTFEPGARFCQECGFDIQSVEPATTDAVTRHPENPEGGATHADNPIEIPVKPVTKGCLKCGNHLEPEERFCPNCGFDNQSIVAEPIAEQQTDKPIVTENVVAPPALVPDIPAQESSKPSCPKCGNHLEPEERFCPSCGFDNQSIVTEPIAEQQTDKPILTEDVVAPPAIVPEIPVQEPSKPSCPKCGTSLEPEERFCPNCGFDNQSIVTEPIAEQQTDKPILTADVVTPPALVPDIPAQKPSKPSCPKCGTTLEPEEHFCAGCGFDTQGMPPSAPEIEVIPPVIKQEATQAPQENKKTIPLGGQFCPECGAAMLADDVFCQECGYKTSDALAATTAEPPKATIPSPPVAPPSKKAKGPPVVPPPVQPPVNVENQTPKKKNKLLLVILLVLLALGVLGGGGYFAYKKFFQNTAKTAAIVPTVEETTPAPDLAEEMQQPDTSGTIETAETPNAKPETEKKNTPPRAKPGKKKAAPKVTEPVKEEPAKPKGPVTVVMNQKTVKKSPRSLYTNYNTEEVKSGPKSTNRIKFDKPTMVTRIITFHHNDGKGATAGTITLEGRKNETGGPWQARNAPGSDGTLNGKWICEPNAIMEAGTYKIVVSNEDSWSYNGKSSRKGFVIVEGYEID